MCATADLHRMRPIDPGMFVCPQSSQTMELQRYRGSKLKRSVRLQRVINNLNDSIELPQSIPCFKPRNFIRISRNLYWMRYTLALALSLSNHPQPP